MPFNLDDYVPVAERLVAFYGEYPKGSIQTDIIELSEKRVVMRATVYRDPADERPSIAHSALSIPGTTQFTRGSEIENAETSAIGRAIAMLGFEVKRGVASREEVRNKGDDETPASATNLTRPPSPEHDGLNGTAEVGKASTSDFQMRMGPDGAVLGFRLTQGRKGFNVLTRDELAMQMLDFRDDIVDQRVTVWGRVVDETFTPNKPNARPVTYQIVHADRIQTPKGILPVKATRDPEQELVDAVPVAEGQEPLPL